MTPASPALSGSFFTTALPGKPSSIFIPWLLILDFPSRENIFPLPQSLDLYSSGSHDYEIKNLLYYMPLPSSPPLLFWAVLQLVHDDYTLVL